MNEYINSKLAASSDSRHGCRELMADKNVGALLVLDNGQLVGMISERDYTRKVTLKGRSSKDTPVQEIMSHEVVTVNEADTISECMRVMTDSRIAIFR